jgi:SAM-dependent methyltransferase
MALRGEGSRQVTLDEVKPNCQIKHSTLYHLNALVRSGMVIADIGCGGAHNKAEVEAAGAVWIGIDPFSVDPDILKATAECLPIPDGSIDIVIMEAVLEHIPDVAKAFSEVARVLKVGGQFIGYVAFMESFHEISYNHLSFKALEEYSSRNGLCLEAISGGTRFGIDYHVARLAEPFVRFNSFFIRRLLRPLIASAIRIVIRASAWKRYIGNRYRRKMSVQVALDDARLFGSIQLLSLSNGFEFVISKPVT